MAATKLTYLVATLDVSPYVGMVLHTGGISALQIKSYCHALTTYHGGMRD